jgi:hypothetical protein
MIKAYFLIGCCLGSTLCALDFDDAHRTYLKYFKEGTAGVFEKQGFAFFLSDIPLDGAGYSSRDKSRLTKKSLSDHHKLVSQYLIELNSLTRPQIPDDSILQKFHSIDEFIKKVNPQIFEQLVRFQLPCVVLENRRKEKFLRYSVAYKKKDLIEQSPKELTWPSNAKILSVLRDFLLISKKLEREDEIYQFYQLTNNLFPQFQNSFEKLNNEFNFNYKTDFSNIGLSELYRRIEIADLLIDNNATISNATRILSKVPLHPKALEFLQRYYQDKGSDPFKAFIVYLQRLPTNAHSNKGIEFEKFNFYKFNNKTDKTRFSLIELDDLIYTIQNSALPEELVDNDLFRENFYKFGFHVIEHSGHSSESSHFEDAKTLFEQGKDLPRIFSLCLQAVQEDSTKYNAWNLLGRSLSLQGYDKFAIPCFIQAILNDPAIRTLSQTNLAISLKNLGYIELANGLALNVLLETRNTSWEFKQCIEILEISYD